MRQQQQLELNRSRSLGDIIGDTFAFLTPNWRTFAAVAGPAVLMGIIFQIAIFAAGPGTLAADATTDELNAYLEDSLLVGGVILLLLPFLWVFQQLSTAGVVVVMQAVGMQRTMAAGDALDAAQDRVRDLLLASLRSALITILFFVSIVGIPWGIKRLVQWSFITQSIMVDGASHRDALQRSADLVKGNWWLTLGRLVVFGILVQLTNSVLGGLIQAIIPDVPGIILAGAVGFFTSPYMIIATSLTYFDYRTRKSQLTTSSSPM